jgi:hypothetical protein
MGRPQHTWERRTSQSVHSDGRDRGKHKARRFGDLISYAEDGKALAAIAGKSGRA